MGPGCAISPTAEAGSPSSGSASSPITFSAVV